MLLENNKNIDFLALEQRIRLEVAKIKCGRLETFNQKSLRPPNANPNRAGRETTMGGKPKRRTFFHRVRDWLWAIRYIRGAFERANLALAGAEDAKARVHRIDNRLEAAFERLTALDNQQLTSEQRLDARQLTLEQRHAAVLARLESMVSELAGLKREILFQQRRLTRLVLPPAKDRQHDLAAIANERFDSFYVAFEDVFRGSRADIKKRLEPYLDRLCAAGASLPDKPVLDIGCGRGEWLELLNDNHIAAYGVDLNSMMIERAVSLGLDARHGDVIEHLRGVEDGAHSAVTAFHVVEHLPLSTLIDFLDEALRVLVPGGVLILETPNPETVRVGATTFYNDPTHHNPIPPLVLKFMVEHRGFEEVEVIRLHPFMQGLLEARTADADLLNRVLFGPQDYAVVARRG